MINIRKSLFWSVLGADVQFPVQHGRVCPWLRHWAKHLGYRCDNAGGMINETLYAWIVFSQICREIYWKMPKSFIVINVINECRLLRCLLPIQHDWKFWFTWFATFWCRCWFLEKNDIVYVKRINILFAIHNVGCSVQAVV